MVQFIRLGEMRINTDSIAFYSPSDRGDDWTAIRLTTGQKWDFPYSLEQVDNVLRPNQQLALKRLQPDG